MNLSTRPEDSRGVTRTGTWRQNGLREALEEMNLEYIVNEGTVLKETRLYNKAGQIHANNFCGAGIATDGIRGEQLKKYIKATDS